MDEQSKTPASSEEKPFRGLYKHVKISVRTLDIIIVSIVVLIIILVALDLTNPGYTIRFDSQGGSDVPHQTQLYGEYLEVPEPPTREGYTFTGWYIDEGCYRLWEQDYHTVQTDMTLYAGWEKNE